MLQVVRVSRGAWGRWVLYLAVLALLGAQVAEISRLKAHGRALEAQSRIQAAHEAAIARALAAAQAAASDADEAAANAAASCSSVPHRFGAYVTQAYPVGAATGDLTGSSYPGPFVGTLSGVGGAGGAVGINGATTFLNFAQNNNGPTISQATVAGTGALGGVNTNITAQAGQQQTGAAANNAGGNLNLSGGLAGTGGSGAAGAPGTVNLNNGSILNAQFAQLSGLNTIWTSPGALNATNYFSQNTGTVQTVNVAASGTLAFAIGGAQSANFTTANNGTMNWLIPNLLFAQNVFAAPLIGQAQQANASVPNNTILAPQAAGNGASTTATGTSGSVVVSVGGAVSTGTEAGLILQRAGLEQLRITGNSSGTPTITEVQQANGSNPNNLVLAPQAPGAGASTTATGTPGSLVVNVAAPVSTGNEAALIVQRAGGTNYWAFGPQPGNSNYGLVWGANASGGRTSGNYIFAIGTGGDVFLQSNANTLSITAGTTGQLLGGGTALSWNSGNAQLFTSSLSFGGGTGVLGIANASVVPTSNPTGGGVAYENAGELSHRGLGGAIYEMAAPGTGTQNTQLATVLARMAFVRTTATTATTIWTSPTITASHVLTIEATCNSIDTTALAASSAASRVACSFVNAAGTVSQLGATTTIFNHNYTTAPVCTISGTTVLLQVSAKTTDTTDTQCAVNASSN